MMIGVVVVSVTFTVVVLVTDVGASVVDVTVGDLVVSVGGAVVGSSVVSVGA